MPMTFPNLSQTSANAVHAAFEWLGIAVGMWLYRRTRRQHNAPSILSNASYSIVMGCILGAMCGNKIVFWLEYPQLFQTTPLPWHTLFSGQSIVGGLLGGLIGVEFAKKAIGSQVSTGDFFVIPLIAGTIIGRFGCLLAGLYDGTYGLPTTLPWAIDFGDGITRHPTQIYDMLFVAFWGGLLWRKQQYLKPQSGLMFKCYLAGYLLWRLCVDSIKPVPYIYPLNLSGIQWICIVALFIYLPFLVRQFKRLHHSS
ncbi:MAG: prolipoprotein diacylglyceryl transferase [Formosimonas sp.]